MKFVCLRRQRRAPVYGREQSRDGILEGRLVTEMDAWVRAKAFLGILE